jgi:sulfoxide reductase heme-binding subunit YedZ
MAFNPTPSQYKGIKAAIFIASLIPFARMVVLSVVGALPDPLAFITHSSGDWALYFLVITLCVTPVRRLLKWNWLVRLRRMVGLYAFFYAFIHFTAFLWFDHWFDVAAMWKDVLKRPFITVGFIAFVLLIPLAVTSNNAMIRKLGGKLWQRIHRLIYVIAPLGIVHYWWLKSAKNNIEQPLIFGVIVAVLLGVRVYWSMTKKKVQAAQVRV